MILEVRRERGKELKVIYGNVGGLTSVRWQPGEYLKQKKLDIKGLTENCEEVKKLKGSM